MRAKRVICTYLLLLVLVFCACSAEQSEPIETRRSTEDKTRNKETTQEKEDKPFIEMTKDEEMPAKWRDAYAEVLSDWSFIRPEQEYMQSYFGEDTYNYDEYMTYDLNGDGTPELFLHSTEMDLTSVFTYKDEVKYLGYYDIDGFNEDTKELIVYGHWHGAGGSGEYEYSTHKINDDMSGMDYMYLDYMGEGTPDAHYTIYDPETEQYDTRDNNDPFYDEYYAEHIEPREYFYTFQRYPLTDETGLDRVSAPGSADGFDAMVLPVDKWGSLKETEIPDNDTERLESLLVSVPYKKKPLYDGGFLARYDYRDATEGHLDTVSEIIANAWYYENVVDVPGMEQPGYVDDDPQGMYEDCVVFRYPQEWVRFYAEEICNCHYDYYWLYYYGEWDDYLEKASSYEENGYYYLGLWGLGGGGRTLVDIESVKTDGTFYYITYKAFHESMSSDDIEEPSYAIVKWKETNGGHWSLYYYRHYEPPFSY